MATPARRSLGGEESKRTPPQLPPGLSQGPPQQHAYATARTGDESGWQWQYRSPQHTYAPDDRGPVRVNASASGSPSMSSSTSSRAVSSPPMDLSAFAFPNTGRVERKSSASSTLHSSGGRRESGNNLLGPMSPPVPPPIGNVSPLTSPRPLPPTPKREERSQSPRSSPSLHTPQSPGLSSSPRRRAPPKPLLLSPHATSSNFASSSPTSGVSPTSTSLTTTISPAMTARASPMPREPPQATERGLEQLSLGQEVLTTPALDDYAGLGLGLPFSSGSLAGADLPSSSSLATNLASSSSVGSIYSEQSNGRHRRRSSVNYRSPLESPVTDRSKLVGLGELATPRWTSQWTHRPSYSSDQQGDDFDVLANYGRSSSHSTSPSVSRRSSTANIGRSSGASPVPPVPAVNSSLLFPIPREQVDSVYSLDSIAIDESTLGDMATATTAPHDDYGRPLPASLPPTAASVAFPPVPDTKPARLSSGSSSRHSGSGAKSPRHSQRSSLSKAYAHLPPSPSAAAVSSWLSSPADASFPSPIASPSLPPSAGMTQTPSHGSHTSAHAHPGATPAKKRHSSANPPSSSSSRRHSHNNSAASPAAIAAGILKHTRDLDPSGADIDTVAHVDTDTADALRRLDGLPSTSPRLSRSGSASRGRGSGGVESSKSSVRSASKGDKPRRRTRSSGESSATPAREAQDVTPSGADCSVPTIVPASPYVPSSLAPTSPSPHSPLSPATAAQRSPAFDAVSPTKRGSSSSTSLTANTSVSPMGSRESTSGTSVTSSSLQTKMTQRRRSSAGSDVSSVQSLDVEATLPDAPPPVPPLPKDWEAIAARSPAATSSLFDPTSPGGSPQVDTDPYVRGDTRKTPTRKWSISSAIGAIANKSPHSLRESASFASLDKERRKSTTLSSSQSRLPQPQLMSRTSSMSSGMSLAEGKPSPRKTPTGIPFFARKSSASSASSETAPPPPPPPVPDSASTSAGRRSILGLGFLRSTASRREKEREKVTRQPSGSRRPSVAPTVDEFGRRPSVNTGVTVGAGGTSVNGTSVSDTSVSGTPKRRVRQCLRIPCDLIADLERQEESSTPRRPSDAPATRVNRLVESSKTNLPTIAGSPSAFNLPLDRSAALPPGTGSSPTDRRMRTPTKIPRLNPAAPTPDTSTSTSRLSLRKSDPALQESLSMSTNGLRQPKPARQTISTTLVTSPSLTAIAHNQEAYASDFAPPRREPGLGLGEKTLSARRRLDSEPGATRPRLQQPEVLPRSQKRSSLATSEGQPLRASVGASGTSSTTTAPATEARARRSIAESASTPSIVSRKTFSKPTESQTPHSRHDVLSSSLTSRQVASRIGVPARAVPKSASPAFSERSTSAASQHSDDEEKGDEEMERYKRRVVSKKMAAGVDFREVNRMFVFPERQNSLPAFTSRGAFSQVAVFCAVLTRSSSSSSSSSSRRRRAVAVLAVPVRVREGGDPRL